MMGNRLGVPRSLLSNIASLLAFVTAIAVVVHRSYATEPTLSMLMLPQDVAAFAGDEHLRILDVRDAASFSQGHVPAAVRLDLSVWDAKTRTAEGMRDRDFWTAAVGPLGIDKNSRIVVYGASPAMSARAWWLLKYVGLPHVALLDGGWSAWKDNQRTVSVEITPVTPRSFSPEFQNERFIEIESLLKSLDAATYRLVDSRSLDEYDGRRRTGARPGRIPGACHLDWQQVLDEQGRFKSREQLRKMFQQRELSPRVACVTYCYSGYRSSVTAFALEWAGYPPVKNFNGGWEQWSARESAPAEITEQ